MKKVLVCMLSALTMLQCATAFAGKYDPDANKVVNIDDSSKKTVMIARNTGRPLTNDDIVYVNQNSGGFVGAEFMLKQNPPMGFYTIMLGGDGNEASKKVFFVGKAEDFTYTVKLDPIADYEILSDDKTTVTKAYATQSAIPLSQAKSVVVKYGEKYAYENLGTITSGGADVMLAVELSGIPADKKNDVQVWISSTQISTEALRMK